jgi:signal transduction histidine kinase/CheY-like chemotaxis protein/HPt (histidine-containing phosphotransfer) domain-containing protein
MPYTSPLTASGGPIRLLLVEQDMTTAAQLKGVLLCIPDLKLEHERELFPATEELQRRAERHDVIVLALPADTTSAVRVAQHFAKLAEATPCILLAQSRQTGDIPESVREAYQLIFQKNDISSPILASGVRTLARLHTTPGNAAPDDALDVLFERNNDGVLLVNGEGVILKANPAAVQLFAHGGKKLEGHRFPYPVRPGETVRHGVAAPGGERTVEITYSPVREDDGSLLLVVARDVSRLAQLEAEAASAREQAHTASRAKYEFLAKMSHEVRTPVNGVIGLTELLLRSEPTDRQRGYLTMVHESAQSLQTIIDDILDLSKIETGRISLERRTFELRPTLDATTGIFAKLCAKKGLRFTSEIHPDIPDRLVGDPTRLRQIIINLLSNAVKYTETGGVDFLVEPVEAAEIASGNHGHRAITLKFTVRDTGAGIADTLQKDIFESFTQGSPLSGEVEGTGLGLTIARELVEMMGGKIDVQSVLGLGSVFTFTCRLAVAANQEAQATEPTQPARPLTILMAEDNEVNRVFTTELIQDEGHTVLNAGDGVKALRILSKNDVDLVLMDIKMPNMDGLEATRRIREGEAGEDKKDVPIIALTAHALRGDREKFLQAGMNDYVSKPIELSELLVTISRWSGSGRARRQNAEQPAPAPETATAPAIPEHNGEACMDRQWLESMREKRLGFLVRMFGVYVKEEPKRFAKLKDAVASRDMEQVDFLAHSIKGASATLGAKEVRRLAYNVEMAAKAGDADAAAQAMPEMDEVMSHTIGFMNRFLAENASEGSNGKEAAV